MDLDDNDDDQSISCATTVTTRSDFSDSVVTATTAASTQSTDLSFFDLSFASQQQSLSAFPDFEAVPNHYLQGEHIVLEPRCLRADYDNDLKLYLWSTSLGATSVEGLLREHHLVQFLMSLSTPIVPSAVLVSRRISIES